MDTFFMSDITETVTDIQELLLTWEEVRQLLFRFKVLEMQSQQMRSYAANSYNSKKGTRL